MVSSSVPRGQALEPEVRRDIAAMAVAVGVVGLSFGAIAVASGLSIWLAALMSLLVFAGGSQFMAVGVVASGGAPLAALAAGLILNARHLPFGLAIGHLLGRGLAARLVGSHLLIDESVAFALAQRDPERARRVYWISGITFFVVWQPAVVLGGLIGGAVGDPAVFGVDAAFPAALLALLLPALRDAATRRAALTGGAVAVLTTPLLPAGVPVLLALCGVALLLPLPRWARGESS
ncbi:AzlC family ABC transporter permease [Actinoalloteichus spitiensis]|uniref:AzlC family ABC transporter permease n=1 Tax=Actinoalloteichus spitiensis TaxID=252394 RepID=UPI00035E513F